jgi:hypothetical protein
VKQALTDWSDLDTSSEQFIYDPPQYGGGGWEEGDDVTNGNFFGHRYHMRLWVIYSGAVIGSVHYEYWDWSKMDHVVISFEQAEEKVACYYSSPWVVNNDWHYMYNSISSPYNNGYATWIYK